MQTDNGLPVETKRAFARNGNFWIHNRDKISYDAIKLGRIGRSYGKCRINLKPLYAAACVAQIASAFEIGDLLGAPG